MDIHYIDCARRIISKIVERRTIKPKKEYIEAFVINYYGKTKKKATDLSRLLEEIWTKNN